ncbi:MAG: phenylalanine--tRNA ligase subunit beta [Candidatus Moranbacteria bacterium]|nr:phenylalanine--tRNA ligase subunit beta [Candidatus Moranbacteria bacterium]
MKYSYTWLKELSGTKLSPEKLADLLTMHSFEFEEMKKEGNETQMVFDILANRGHDALSHIGMAREICAVEGRKFANGDSISIREIESPSRRLKIEIKDSPRSSSGGAGKKLCWRYIGAVIENIKVAPSPKWMQERLLVSGVKPINNIVDITNYVMLETGQPLHAFDASKTTGNIIVRRAKKGEKLKLLDEKEYELGESDLVIADSQKALALAGVMGGIESSVTRKTKKIILESANFNSTNIRKTRTAHNVITESSYRFERDIDPNLAEIGAARAIELLQKYGGNDVKLAAYTDVYPKKLKSWQIKLSADYVNSLLGEKVPVSRIKNILENLGLGVKISKNILNCEIPTRRLDLKTQEDLIEEIGRIYGYENISAKAPCVELQTPMRNEKRILEDKLRDILIGSGFSEVMNYSFYSQSDIEKCGLGIEGHFEVANPMNPNQQYMRRSMIPNLLKNIELNLKHFDKINIFEIGRKYRDEKKSSPTELSILTGVLADTKNENPFFNLKGVIEAISERLGCTSSYEIHKPKYTAWHAGRVAEIFIKGEKVGKIGEINPLVCKRYGIQSRVALFGISIAKLLDVSAKEKTYSPIGKFPSVKRDISMFVGEKTKYADIESKIYHAGGKLVLGVELFDIFEKEGEKSMALRIEIGSREKTLTSAEIDGVMKKIISKLEKDLRVKVRK